MGSHCSSGSKFQFRKNMKALKMNSVAYVSISFHLRLNNVSLCACAMSFTYPLPLMRAWIVFFTLMDYLDTDDHLRLCYQCLWACT